MSFLVFQKSSKLAVSSILKNMLQEVQTLNLESIILKSKKLQLTTLVVLGILVYHFISSRYIGKDQKTVKSEMRQNQQKDFGKKLK